MAAAFVHASTRSSTFGTDLILHIECPGWLVYSGLRFSGFHLHIGLMQRLIQSVGQLSSAHYDDIDGNATFSALVQGHPHRLLISTVRCIDEDDEEAV